MHQFPEEATGQGRACKTHELLGAGATFPLRAADISHMKGFPYSHTSGKERQKEEVKKWQREGERGKMDLVQILFPICKGQTQFCNCLLVPGRP